MRATFETRRLAPPEGGSVVSIGVFDGVHRGHKAILRANVARAHELGAEPTVVTFRRHPKRVLLGRAPKLLTTLEHRFELFRRAGIVHVVALTFDEELRDMSPEDFTRDVLVDGLGARHFVLGFDNKFGRDARGTPELLRELGYSVDVVGQVLVRQRPVSSTAIREAVELGDLEKASAMLGRPVSVIGRVVHGDHLGRELGVPTANLNLAEELHPPHGVYAVRARVLAREEDRGRGEALPAVANIGVRPTVDAAAAESRVEVHLLDYEGDLYGAHLEVEFVRALREERSFPDLAALAEQLQLDIERAREVLGIGGAAGSEDG